jgi:hypothetical protein
MPLSTTTLDYRLYLMALILEESLQPGALRSVRVRGKEGEELLF